MKESIKKDNKKNKVKRNVLILFFLLLLTALFPYTGDDWAWGSKIGITRLN